MPMVNALEVDHVLVQHKFRIEMRFSLPGSGGSEDFEWYYGTVSWLVNKKKRSVKIAWHESCLHDDDLLTTTNVLLISRWNEKVPVAGTWRQYLAQFRPFFKGKNVNYIIETLIVSTEILIVS